MVEWRCRCPICRSLVYPILKLASTTSAAQKREHEIPQSSEEVESGAEEGIERFAKFAVRAKVSVPEQQTPQVTTVTQQTPSPVPSTAPTPPLQTPTVPPTSPTTAVPAEQTQQTSQQERPSESESQQTEQTALPPNIIERLQQLEEELAKIKSYVKASIDGIKATLVDLRSAIAELSNPFNILRKYADIFFGEEESPKKERKEKERSESHIQSVVQPLYPVTAIPIVAYPIQQPSQIQQTTQTQQPSPGSNGDKELATKTSLTGNGKRIDAGAIERFTTWLNKALEKIGLENVVKIIDSYVRAGILTPELGEALKTLASIVDELRKTGVSHDEQISMIVDFIRSLSPERRDHEIRREEEKKEEVKEKAESGAQELLELIEGG